MDLNGQIKIDKAIVHVLNQDKNNGGHFLSDYELELDDKLEILIIKHINEAFRHSLRLFAKFKNENNIVKECCLKIIENSDNFINESKNISKELFSAMKGKNASSANLLICRYMRGTSKSVAIIKLDFDESFYTEKLSENNKTKIIVKINKNGFNKSQKLRKCAIIDENIIKEDMPEFLLLDTQNGEEVSNYFKVSFLNCELVNDCRTNTKNMIREVMDFINKKYDSEPQKMVKKTYVFTSKLESAENFNIDEILSSVFEKKELRNEFKEIVKSKKIDFSFNIDKKYVEKKLSSRTLITENGISLRAKASLFNSNDIEIKDKKDGIADIIIKNVRIGKNKI